ncbi:MAG: sulfur oxidation c-type cytochrome SoxX [Duganella sp.]
MLGIIGAAALATAMTMAAASAAAPPYLVQGDAIVLPLDGLRGDPARGRAIVANRQVGLCLLCHTGPIAEERFQGNLAPDLQGAGARWSAAQLRLRIVDSRHLNPETIMPSYYNSSGLERVAGAFQGQTIFSAQQVEDVVAWLATLKEPAP